MPNENNISFASKQFEDLAIEHEVNVNPSTGAAVVSIVVPLREGRNGFGPALALQYNSSAGNSLYGMGWSLSGLPSI